MIKKVLIGNDIVHIPRFSNSLSVGNFIQKVFHTDEIKYCENKDEKNKVLSYAARYAAKEAFSKALGTGLFSQGIAPKDIWITNNKLGKPLLNFSNNVNDYLANIGIIDMDVSLSHHVDYALATVILLLNKELNN